MLFGLLSWRILCCIYYILEIRNILKFYIIRTAKVKDADWNNPIASDTTKIVNSQPGAGRSGNSSVPDNAPQGGYIQRINNDAREDEMEENMQAVGSILGNLKNMAQDMGDEIGKQNKDLERIGAKVTIFILF